MGLNWMAFVQSFKCSIIKIHCFYTFLNFIDWINFGITPRVFRVAHPLSDSYNLFQWKPQTEQKRSTLVEKRAWRERAVLKRQRKSPLEGVETNRRGQTRRDSDNRRRNQLATKCRNGSRLWLAQKTIGLPRFVDHFPIAVERQSSAVQSREQLQWLTSRKACFYHSARAWPVAKPALLTTLCYAFSVVCTEFIYSLR